MASDFKLFPFQEDASESLRTAALNWVATAAADGPPKYGTNTIPFIGQLRAVTGAGKTPILAQVLGGLGDGVVVWTSRSSAVVEQTFNNLRGKYSPLLPAGVKIIRDIQGQSVWRELIESKTGLTVWLLTVASWNEAESAKGSGDAAARLNLHRPQPDWAGDTSPWDQLRRDLQRPLWIVSDESHNQSATQLDLLADLRPKGFLMASATPVVNERFAKWREALADDPWASILRASTVSVRTRDVVEAELLKTTVEVIDFNSGSEESLDGALERLKLLNEAVKSESAPTSPRAIYVVEKSNPPKGSKEDARPVAIWKHLRARGVPAAQIAIYTDTKLLPEDAERVTSLAGLHPRFRHIIFNQTLQEGWDDPEAYVCYFDGVTRSYTRIKQIVGRVLRQPRARHFKDELLNTATLLINTPAKSYDTVISELRTELRLYAPENEPEQSAIKIKTRKQPLQPIPVKIQWKKKLSLPNRTLKAPDMAPAAKIIKAAERVWAPEMLEAPGIGRRTVVSLEKEQFDSSEYLAVLRSARTQNGAVLRRYIQHRNRACLHAIHPDTFTGPGFSQFSCMGSVAQGELRQVGERVAEYFEAGVEYQDDPDPETATWNVSDHQPRGSEPVPFSRAAHPHYSTLDFNTDELEFANALDSIAVGVWVRNPANASTGFGIPLPAKVGDSSRFYPDFIWRVSDAVCWALDTTGRHLLDAKVRGKLIGLDRPRVALVVRGQVDLTTSAIADNDGWTLIRARAHLPLQMSNLATL